MKNFITYKQLAIILVAFIFGILTILLINNFLVKEAIQFSTLGLLAFVFSIVFASASIVLAITAINLGRKSEEIMIQRSDKSIELQNEVYIKTTEALKKIESSTGVTEKRIEDIISGRAGDIATKLMDDKLIRGKNKELITEQIRNAVETGLGGSKRILSKEEEEQRLKYQEANILYNDFKDNVLLSIANTGKVKSLKIGDGRFRGKELDLVDGAFKINENIIGVCTFYCDPMLKEKFEVDMDFVGHIYNELSNKTFNKVFFVFDKECGIYNLHNEALNKAKSTYNEELSDSIQVVYGNPEKIANIISEI